MLRQGGRSHTTAAAHRRCTCTRACMLPGFTGVGPLGGMPAWETHEGCVKGDDIHVCLWVLQRSPGPHSTARPPEGPSPTQITRTTSSPSMKALIVCRGWASAWRVACVWGVTVVGQNVRGSVVGVTTGA